MISRILFTLLLVAGLTAKAQTENPECNYSIKGVEFFPWSTATLPFPWNDIQGVWKLSTDSSIYLKAKVISSTKNRKILRIELVSTERCATLAASGTGFVDVGEKNVVRAILTDGKFRYQLKLGMFDSKMLNMDARLCGPNILAATVKILGNAPLSSSVSVSVRADDSIQSMVLKKISSDLNAICKKPAAH